jgi:biopolymer transport protein ExbD
MRLIGLGLGSLLLFSTILLLTPTKTVEGEIAEALGCRSTASIIIVEIQGDGSVLWPNGDTCTIQEAAQQLSSRSSTYSQPVLAVKADASALMVAITPLLKAAEDFGMQQVIFSATGDGPVKIYRR